VSIPDFLMRFRPQLVEDEANLVGVDNLGAKPKDNLSDPPRHIYSRLLDTDLWVVPDGWTGELQGPVYTGSEIRELDRLQATPDELRKIHAAKMVIDGEIEG